MGEKMDEMMNKNSISGDMNEEAAQAEELPLEAVMAQVEQCIEKLENPQISLEDSFRYYEEGIRKLKICNDKVAQIEQKMLVMNNRGELEDF